MPAGIRGGRRITSGRSGSTIDAMPMPYRDELRDLYPRNAEVINLEVAQDEP
jgi:hypothetical protein